MQSLVSSNQQQICLISDDSKLVTETPRPAQSNPDGDGECGGGDDGSSRGD